MSVPELWQPFRHELREATLRNLELLRAGRLGVAEWHVGSARAADAAKRAASWLHARTRYAFDERLPACSADECLRRGFTACADVAALGAAVAMMRDASNVDAVLLTSPLRPGYAHVVLEVDGAEVDPYAFRALPAQVCTVVARWSLARDVTG